MKRLIAAACGALLMLLSALSHAAGVYPDRPITIIVPFAAGGTSDILARSIGQKLTERLGQPVIVDNRPGASGNIGALMEARAPADGYTLLLMDVGNLAISPSLYGDLHFSVPKDFAPVMMVGFSPHSLIVSRKLPVNNLADLINYAKKHPGKLNFGASSGIGSAAHLAGILLANRAGIDWAYVPYKGGAQALTDIVSGQIDVTMIGVSATAPQIKAGTVKAIGMSGATRTPQFPDVPTIAETLPGYLTGTWQGLLAPRGTPPAVVNQLNREISAILKLPDMRRKFDDLGMETVEQSPAQFNAWLKDQVKVWSKVVHDNHVHID
jgi:tripartite-type tricarboxylate transporter receptor subunit TctC